MNKKLVILIESISEEENEDEDEDEDEKRDDVLDDEYGDGSEDDDDLDDARDGLGQGEPGDGDVRSDEAGVVAKGGLKHDDGAKIDFTSKDATNDDAKNSKNLRIIADVNQQADPNVDDDKVDVASTIASVVDVVEKIIESSNPVVVVSSSEDVSQKNNLEMVVFQKTHLLRPQKWDWEKGPILKYPFMELTSGDSKSGFTSVSPDESLFKVVKYVGGLCSLDDKIGEPVDSQLESEFDIWLGKWLRKQKST
ncbi:hypothetical protein CsatA_009308 [Cannabis sativa]